MVLYLEPFELYRIRIVYCITRNISTVLPLPYANGAVVLKDQTLSRFSNRDRDIVPLYHNSNFIMYLSGLQSALVATWYLAVSRPYREHTWLPITETAWAARWRSFEGKRRLRWQRYWRQLPGYAPRLWRGRAPDQRQR